MVTVTSDSGDCQHEQDQRPDHRPTVVKSALLAAGGFASAIATILVVAGEWNISDGTVRFAITVVGVIAAIAQLTAAVYVARRAH